MTVPFALFGLVVYFFSVFTAGFKTALLRLICVTAVGLCIDMFIIITSYHVLNF